MIRFTRPVRVHVHDGPADMRKSYDTLAALVKAEIQSEIQTGDVFLFVGKDQRRAKVLFFDGTGLCILQKRLSKGRFRAVWEGREMTSGELAMFLKGSVQVWAPAPTIKAEEMLLAKTAFR